MHYRVITIVRNVFVKTQILCDLLVTNRQRQVMRQADWLTASSYMKNDQQKNVQQERQTSQ